MPTRYTPREAARRRVKRTMALCLKVRQTIRDVRQLRGHAKDSADEMLVAARDAAAETVDLLSKGLREM